MSLHHTWSGNLSLSIGVAASDSAASPADMFQQAEPILERSAGGLGIGLTLAQSGVDLGLELVDLHLHAFGLDDDHAACAFLLATANREHGVDDLIDDLALGLARLGEQREVRTDRDRRRHCEVATVTAHDLDDERAVVRGRCIGDLVARLDDRVHRRIDADRQPGEPEVVVDRGRHARDLEWPAAADLRRVREVHGTCQ